MRHAFRRGVIAITLVLASGSGAADAETPRLRPDLPEPLGERCVEPPEIMRRRHMEFLDHHRDDVVINGIRTTKHSLQGCLDCHVRTNAQGVYPRHTDSGHFCMACHEFSSVSIDCFSCHADRPASFYEKHARGAHGLRAADFSAVRSGLHE